MKKLISLLLCVFLIASCLSGCGGGQTDPNGETDGAQYQETITIGINADAVNRDVQNTSSIVDKANATLYLDTLVNNIGGEGVITAGLAVEWSELSATEWQFELREGVKFHDGSDFTAEDVKFTFERGLEQSQSKPKLNSISEVEVVNDDTIIIHLTHADPDILYKLSDRCTSIYSKTAFENMTEEEAFFVGTGPFEIKEWTQGSQFSFERFDEHWGGPANTKNIVIKYIPEAAARLVALQTGEIDVCLEPPATDLHYVSDDPNLVLQQINGTNLRYVWFNVNVAPFNNQLVRQAISYAINRQDIIAMVYNGNATESANVMHIDSEFANANAKKYDYDIEKAKELLAQAGYPNGFDTTIYCTTGNTQKAVATVVQSQLSEIDVNVRIEAQESATFSSGVKPGGSYDMAVDGWGGYVQGPDYALRTVFYSTGPTNRCNVSDPVLDALIDEGFASSDFETRRALSYELQDYIMEQALWVPIAIERINVATKSTIEGFTRPHGTIHNYRNLYIVNQ